MQSVALGQNVDVEIISAYTATNQPIQAVASAPAWNVIGAFYMPADASVKLECIGFVTLAGVELSCRLFDVAGAAPVSGSDTAVIDGTVTERQVSGAFELTGRKLYQIQAQVIGDTAEIGVVHAASLVNG